MLDLVARFAIGALVVGLAVWISEVVDARLGGLVTAIPKTSAVSLFVITLEHGGAFAAETAISSMYGSIAVIAYATAFAVLPRLLPCRWASSTHVLALALAIYAAVVAPYVVGLEGSVGLATNLVLVASAYLVSRLLVSRARRRSPCPHEDAAPASPALSGRLRYIVPGLVGGVLVLGATLVADLLGPVWGGIAAVFPANVTAVLVSGSILMGPDRAFDQAAGVPDGVLAGGAFLLGLYWLLPETSLLVAGLAAYLAWALTAWGVTGALDSPSASSTP